MRTIIFRPTNECNLACKYCYDINNHKDTIQNIRNNATGRLQENEDMLLNGIHSLYEGERDKVLIFHGGEPLLIKPEALDHFCSNLDKKIKIHIQTNGTLIDKDVIDLFKKYNFRVGVSLDGCNKEQNSYRVHRNGRGSFDTVMSKLKLLEDNDVRFGVIMSLSKKHLGSEQELYDFTAKNNIHSNIRRIFANNQFTETMTDEEYVDFFNKLFDIWYDDDEKRVQTRQIMELATELESVLVGESPRFCSSSDDCFRRYISLDVEGDLYACNRLYGVPEFYYGNMSSLTKEELMYKIEQLLEKRNQSINSSECATCERLSKCNGGCPAESYDMYGDYTKANCDYKVKKLIRSHIQERVNND